MYDKSLRRPSSLEIPGNASLLWLKPLAAYEAQSHLEKLVSRDVRLPSGWG